MEKPGNTENSTLLFSEIDRHKDNIYVLQHELKKVVPLHSHPQGHILIVMNDVAIVDVENNAFYIPYGHFVWIPSGKSHHISFEDRTIQLLCIYYPQNFSDDSFYQEVGIYPIPTLLHEALNLIKDETREYASKEWKYELLSTLNHILPNIIAQKHSQLWLPTTQHPIAQKIVSAIQRNYRLPISAQSIADEVGMSVRTMSRYMHNELGISFIQYLRKYRIIMSVKQLVKGEDSITNIAYSVGYESLSVFSNSFHMVTGYRPSYFLK